MIWSNGAKCAFNLDFDLDGETIWRNKVKRPPGGAAFVKGPSIGAYGPNKGAAWILEILEEFHLKATWFIPAVMIGEHPGTVGQTLDRGHEISHHGLNHMGRCGDMLTEQQDTIGRCQDIFLKYTGRRVSGIRPTGTLLPETEKWPYNGGGFLYPSAGTSGEGRGYYYVDGERTGGINVPCQDEQMNDYVQTVLHPYHAALEGTPRITSYDVVYSSRIREIEGMVRFGTTGSSVFHPQTAGMPGRVVMLERLYSYLADNRDIWCAPCLDIAKYHKTALEVEHHEWLYEDLA